MAMIDHELGLGLSGPRLEQCPRTEITGFNCSSERLRQNIEEGILVSQVILHHYPLSPYSEKIRLALGLKGVSWNSVEIPVWTPRPKLTPMTNLLQGRKP
jgi:hypothetical protein